jgi:hypothetical protein
LAAFRVGGQYLLTTKINQAEVIDLSPLELELKATTDCRAPAYPHDLWHKGF